MAWTLSVYIFMSQATCTSEHTRTHAVFPFPMRCHPAQGLLHNTRQVFPDPYYMLAHARARIPNHWHLFTRLAMSLPAHLTAILGSPVHR